MAKLTVFKAQYVNNLREKIKDNEEHYRKADNTYFCSENKYNLASKQYSLPFEKVLLMQGEKKLNSSELAK